MGPLPPAQELAAYEAVHPGAAKWILDQAALNAQHVRDMEARALRIEGRDVALHRILPVVVILCFLAACTAIALVGHVWWALGGIIATLGAVLTVYLSRR